MSENGDGFRRQNSEKLKSDEKLNIERLKRLQSMHMTLPLPYVTA